VSQSLSLGGASVKGEQPSSPDPTSSQCSRGRTLGELEPLPLAQCSQRLLLLQTGITA
jgi:hypothetical protein